MPDHPRVGSESIDSASIEPEAAGDVDAETDANEKLEQFDEPRVVVEEFLHSLYQRAVFVALDDLKDSDHLQQFIESRESYKPDHRIIATGSAGSLSGQVVDEAERYTRSQI